MDQSEANAQLNSPNDANAIQKEITYQRNPMYPG